MQLGRGVRRCDEERGGKRCCQDRLEQEEGEELESHIAPPARTQLGVAGILRLRNDTCRKVRREP